MRTTATAAVTVFVASFTACGGGSVAPEPSAIRFTVEPSGHLREVVEQRPSDFTWEEFGREVVVRATTTDGTPAEGTLAIKLCAVSIDGTGRVFDETCSDELRVPADRLADGVKSGELLGDSGSSLREHGVENSPLGEHAPGGIVVPPDPSVAARQRDVALSVAAEYGGDDPTMWYAEVVYARPSVVHVGKEPARVRPFGVKIDIVDPY